MPSPRTVVRVVLISAESRRGDAMGWRERIERELVGTAVTHLPLQALRTADGAPVLLDVDVAILLPEGTDADAERAFDSVLRSLGHGSGDAESLVAARIVAVTPTEWTSARRFPCDRFTDASAERDLVPYLRGVIACAGGLREARRELGLLNRVVGSMRSELEERSDELHLAALVQQDFLPLPLPAIHGVRVSSLYRPLAQVSGDVYNIEQVDEDCMSVFLADAVGHGIPAALLGMAVCRALETTERVGGATRVLGPSETLFRANKSLVERQRATTRFATAVAALVDCRRRVLRLSTAGHPPAILLRPGEAPRILEVDGGLLGVFPDEFFNEIEVPLETNDRILLYSDGFEQAFLENGAARHVDEFARLGGILDSEQLVREIAMRLDAHSGSLHPADDLTLLCISVEEAAQARLAA
jgi:serine phosphatase RsbU (regulator of sigma subunit)